MKNSLRAVRLFLLLAASCGGRVESGESSDGGIVSADTGAPPDDAATDAVGPARRVPIQLSAGVNYTCALFSDATVSCWGQPANGGLGGPNSTPTPLVGATGERMVAVGASANCLLSQGGAVSCFGDDEYGAVGDGQSGYGIVVAALTQIVASQAQAVSMGFAFGCALDTSGAVSCWGWNSAYQIGPEGGPLMFSDSMPTLVTGLPPIGAIGTGAAHACALSADRQSVSCWGQDVYGELGDGLRGMTFDRPTPAPVVGLPSGVAALAVGGSVSCVVTTTGDLWCWGDNGEAQVGTGAPGAPVMTPTQVAGLTGVAQASLGATDEECAVTTTGDTYCWGNSFAVLGDADGGASYVGPTLVSGVPAAAQVATGNAHACVLGVDSTVWCWGSNEAGQCGPLATGNVAATPVQVPF